MCLLPLLAAVVTVRDHLTTSDVCCSHLQHAGGFFGGGFDIAWAANNFTETGPGGGARPRALQWNHVALSYASSAIQPGPTGGLEAGVVSLYINGQLNRQYSMILAVVRNPVFSVGQFTTNTGAFAIGSTGLYIAQVRLHDGLLTHEDIAFNYAADAAFYRSTNGAVNQASIPTPPPTPTPSPSAGAAINTCPTSFASTTHYLKTISLNNVNDTSAYARHCGYWLFWTSNYPVTDAVSAGDASQVRNADLRSKQLVRHAMQDVGPTKDVNAIFFICRSSAPAWTVPQAPFPFRA